MFVECLGQLREHRGDAENAEVAQRVESDLRPQLRVCNLCNLWIFSFRMALTARQITFSEQRRERMIEICARLPEVAYETAKSKLGEAPVG